MNKAKFFTKIVAPNEDYTSHNGEVVEILDKKVYKSGFIDTRYTIKFNDGTIAKNIMEVELDFEIN